MSVPCIIEKGVFSGYIFLWPNWVLNKRCVCFKIDNSFIQRFFLLARAISHKAKFLDSTQASNRELVLLETKMFCR
jgi:hypothetical protein